MTRQQAEIAPAHDWTAAQTPVAAKFNEGCGGFRELAPTEMKSMKGLTIVALKVAGAATLFAGFHKVIALESSRNLEAHLSRLEPNRPIAVVCPDGTCSTRVATRLANQGRTVYHLAGGIRDWNFINRPSISVDG